MMNYIILDLEWNQSGEKAENLRYMPPFEIIEIGAVKMSPEFEILGEFDEVIHPQLYTTLHPITRKVTHIKEEELAGARKIRDVMRDFFAWCGEDYILCTWGDRDLTELQRNLDFFHLKNPLKRPLFFYDLQKLYGLYFDGERSQKSLETAVEEREIPKNLAFHRASADTYYTALVMATIDMQQMGAFYSIDYYHLPEGNGQLTVTFPGYNKYVSHGFADRDSLTKNTLICNMECCICGRRLKKKIRWFAAAKTYHLCVAICPEHGLMKGKLRIRKTDRGTYFGIKTIKPITEEEMEKIRQRKTGISQHRRHAEGK